MFRGKRITAVIFGASHEPEIGGTLLGFPAGIVIDEESLKEALRRRRPARSDETSRVESDVFRILSGVHQGKSTGAPLSLVIENRQQDPADYENLPFRGSHGDWGAYCHSRGHADLRGGGTHSGRLTAVMTLLGALCLQALPQELEIQSFLDRFSPDQKAGRVHLEIRGVPAGLGGHFFDNAESRFAQVMFAIPGVKALEFGLGTDFLNYSAEESLDQYEKGSLMKLGSNHNGGMCGGYTNGETLHLGLTMKPPSSSVPQWVYDREIGETRFREQLGRHDQSYLRRVLPVAEMLAAMVLLDLWEGELARQTKTSG